MGQFVLGGGIRGNIHDHWRQRDLGMARYIRVAEREDEGIEHNEQMPHAVFLLVGVGTPRYKDAMSRGARILPDGHLSVTDGECLITPLGYAG